MTDARIALGLTVTEFALRAGLQPSQVCALEVGRLTPFGEWDWRSEAVTAATFLGFSCAELWPEHAPRVPRLCAEAVPTPESLCEEAQLRGRLDAAVAALPPRLATVIRLRFGLDADDDGIIFREVGKAIGLNRERARQLEVEALRLLKDAMTRG